jgi:hypothetical protein
VAFTWDSAGYVLSYFDDEPCAESDLLSTQLASLIQQLLGISLVTYILRLSPALTRFHGQWCNALSPNSVNVPTAGQWQALAADHSGALHGQQASLRGAGESVHCKRCSPAAQHAGCANACKLLSAPTFSCGVAADRSCVTRVLHTVCCGCFCTTAVLAHLHTVRPKVGMSVDACVAPANRSSTVLRT